MKLHWRAWRAVGETKAKRELRDTLKTPRLSEEVSDKIFRTPGNQARKAKKHEQ